MTCRASVSLCVFTVLGILAHHAARAASIVPSTPASTDVLQVLADLTLIDDTCRDDLVDFGIGFRFAAANGVADTAVLPGGPRRPEFEAVLRSRRDTFDGDELCGAVAENYAEALPGSIRVRPGGGLRP